MKKLSIIIDSIILLMLTFGMMITALDDKYLSFAFFAVAYIGYPLWFMYIKKQNNGEQ